MNDLHGMLDAAVLAPLLTPDEARAAIGTCIAFRARTACVKPCDIPLATALCKGTATAVSCVLAFPHGNALPAIKTAEARACIELGVAEIDMVVNYGLIPAGEWSRLEEDIRAVTSVAGPAGVAVKTIFETCYLTPGQIGRATDVAVAAGAAFVKTSTGFAEGGASETAVRAMLDAAKGRVGVKASGGIRDAATARRYLAMGCRRLGVGYTALQALCGDGPAGTGRY